MTLRVISALAGLLLCAAPLAAQQQMVQEPNSGVGFPAVVMSPAGDSLLLMGTGIRTRTILKIQVYAYGLYVDPRAARARLTMFAGVPHRQLENDRAFYDALLGMNFTMALRLVMTRDVGADDMASAFEDALRPRVEAAAERGLAGGVQALATFRTFFDVGEMTNGSELLFTCAPNGTLHTRIKGTAAPTLESPALCWALFDVYLGENPISRDGKKSLIMGFPNLLYQRR